MNTTEKSEGVSVYEIGYLIVSSVPEEQVPVEASLITALVTKAGAEIVAEEAPHRMRLAYEMRKKNVGGTYAKYNEAYFGWVKFALSPDAIDGIKKSVEAHPSVLRMLVTTTVRENTYLGKRAPAIAAEIVAAKIVDKVEEEKKDVVAPATVEDMDKSIDDMVKEA
jgi:ribosomal protein S6